MTGRIDLGDLPLYWRVSGDRQTPGPFPPRAPFSLAYNADLDLIVQPPDARMKATLAGIYRSNANVGYLQDENSLARPYFEDFYAHLRRIVVEHRVQSALEIGCGGCIVLEALSRDGIECTGIDPSPVAIACGAEKGVRVIPEFFPSASINVPVDMIFHADVLEHSEDPAAFLQLHSQYLKPGGLVVVSVPDCEDSIQFGDISMVIHQHLSYFDRASMMRVAQAAGFELIDLRRAGHGGSMYATMRAGAAPARRPAGSAGSGKFDAFQAKFNASNARFRELLGKAVRGAPDDIGFYVPLRAFPYLARNGLLDAGHRIFDDTPTWHRRLFDGYGQPVENLADLVARPVRMAFVMSLAFSDLIAGKIAAASRERIDVVPLRQFL